MPEFEIQTGRTKFANLQKSGRFGLDDMALSREQVAVAQLNGDYTIKSEKSAPALDTSQWPLLLKNYDKLLVRSSHFTPIPSGCSPLKRDISSYIKYAPSPSVCSLINCLIGRVSSTLTNLPTLLLMRLSPG